MNNPTTGEAVSSIINANADLFLMDMSEWLADIKNWLVWSAFEYEANRAWEKRKGDPKPHYSARTIGEYLRHHTAMRDSGSEFKVNDHAWPELARLYMLSHPERDGFFELRGRAGWNPK